MWESEEITACVDRFAAIAAQRKPITGYWNPDFTSTDPLLRWPRIMHPHRFDQLALRMMLDSRIKGILVALMEENPIATQSMFYFKPPGAKGQA